MSSEYSPSTSRNSAPARQGIAPRARPLDRTLANRQPARTKSKTPSGGTIAMSKPAKTEAELIAMAVAELKVHADCPDGMVISVLRDGDSWEFRVSAEQATIDKPGYP